MKETTPRVQRIYIRMSYPGQGMAKLHASLTPPAYDEPLLVLLSRGVMPMGQPFSMLLVSDPTQNPGMKGAKGDTGPQGSAGPKGDSGSIGPVGPQGPAGAQGPKGEAGLQGAAGVQGPKGDTGAAGPAGTKGDTGATGPAGPQGAKGDTGSVGPVGPQGPTGSQGPKGDTGVPGPAGTPATTMLGSITLAESNLVSVSAGVRRRVIATTFDLPLGVPLLLIPKSAPPVGYIVQAAWATKTRELTADLTLPAITALTSYSFDNWLLRLN